jgi:arylsulfatase A-like enzyme
LLACDRVSKTTLDQDHGFGLHIFRFTEYLLCPSKDRHHSSLDLICGNFFSGIRRNRTTVHYFLFDGVQIFALDGIDLFNCYDWDDRILLMTKSISRREFLKISAGGLVGAAVLGTGLNKFNQYRQLNALAEPPANAPNVLLIVLDTVRAASLSLYGYSRPTTPNLERIAKKGVVFENAFASDSWTLPSHSSMFTARYPHKLSSDWQFPLDGTHPTLAEAFTNNGYLTSGFAANTYYCSYENGLSRGFQHYEDYRVTLGQAIRNSPSSFRLLKDSDLRKLLSNNHNFGRKSAEQLVNDFLGWLEQAGTSRPFFSFMNFFDAHDPYLPPREYAMHYSRKRLDGFLTQEDARELKPERLVEMNDAYDAAITYLDDQLGRLFIELEKRGKLKDTLVIVTADHGEQFGEHELVGHGNSLYTQLTKIPLMMIHPGLIPENLRIQSPVSFIDIPVTLQKICNLDNSISFHGSSLKRAWETQRIDNKVYSEVLLSWDVNSVPTERGWLRSIVSQDMHYLDWPSGKNELFNYWTDPQEKVNLINEPEYSGLINELHQSMIAALK